MKKIQVLLMSMFALAVLTSCGEGENSNSSSNSGSTSVAVDDSQKGENYDPKRGLGKFDESNVDVSAFDSGMAEKGKGISEVKCTSCHKVDTDEKLVGPGWKGVTSKHTPYWIMNFITNPDPMIDVDPELQTQLELCLVRMPNQGLSDDEAREILEYMREIDGAQ